MPVCVVLWVCRDVTKMNDVIIVIEEINKTEKYQIGKDHKIFASLKEATTWIKTESQGHKRFKIYRDGVNHKSIHVGYGWSYWDNYSDHGKFIHEIWTEILLRGLEHPEQIKL